MIIRPLKHLIYSSFLILSISCQTRNAESGSSVSTPPQEDALFPVTKIVDGDTFWVDNGTAKGLKIRFIGIDAPEARRMFDREIGYYGKEAKQYLTDMLANQKVKLLTDVQLLDRYGRTLAYVYLEDGTFVNADLIKNGYAVLMTVPPNIAYVDYFVKLQNEARDEKRGLWANDSGSKTPN